MHIVIYWAIFGGILSNIDLLTFLVGMPLAYHALSSIENIVLLQHFRTLLKHWNHRHCNSSNRSTNFWKCSTNDGKRIFEIRLWRDYKLTHTACNIFSTMFLKFSTTCTKIAFYCHISKVENRCFNGVARTNAEYCCDTMLDQIANYHIIW